MLRNRIFYSLICINNHESSCLFSILLVIHGKRETTMNMYKMSEVSKPSYIVCSVEDKTRTPKMVDECIH